MNSVPQPRHMVIVGATSAVAQAVARELVSPAARMVVVGRNPEKLRLVEDDLRARGVREVYALCHNVLDYEQNAQLLPEVVRRLGSIDLLLLAHGVLPDQKAGEEDFTIANETLAVNFVSLVSIITPFANYFAAQKAGTIAVISSVAGERGRQSNYLYGSAKGGLSLYLQGLRHRLHRFGVQVVTIKLGLVESPMTAHMAPNPLRVTPRQVAPGIVKAIRHRRDVVYVPWFWQPIMALIRAIPEGIFKRLAL